MRVLIADDNDKVAQQVKLGLSLMGFEVDAVVDGTQALSAAQSKTYDAIVLDIAMPVKDGFAVLKELRAGGNTTPVIFLTGFTDVRDRVHGLESGGDDYLTKPFAIEELAARIRAVGRRGKAPGATMTVGDLELDLMSRTAVRKGIKIELTNREFLLLETLMSASPEPVPKAVLMEKVWGQKFDSGTNVLNVHVKNLRDKIHIPDNNPLLHTVRHVGFAVYPSEGKVVPEEEDL